MLLFGEKLRSLRHKHVITQVELARKVGLGSYTHITKLEAGQRNASLGLIIRLANLFDITTDYFLRDTIPVSEIQVPNRQATGATEASLHILGSRLRSLRLLHNVSQGELAQQLGLARQAYISNLEAGRKEPSPELIVQIADLFGVTTDYLLRDMPTS
jgi:transcriptional regulator with XRE-family HTH domain